MRCELANWLFSGRVSCGILKHVGCLGVSSVGLALPNPARARGPDYSESSGIGANGACASDDLGWGLLLIVGIAIPERVCIVQGCTRQ